ncbi:MAG: hypothetical protein AB8G23_11870 [Myxococcota bacterium]
MIAIIGLAGLSCFMLVSLWVGLRLLLLARRTNQLPETLVGASLFLSGGLGLALAIGAEAIPGLSVEVAHLIRCISIMLSAVGYGALYLFVWLVFRRKAIWGKLLFALCTGALLVGTVGDILTREAGEPLLGVAAKFGPFAILSVFSRMVAYGWASWESFAYYGMMNRRVAIGLADEALANRFWHWGVCMSSCFMVWVVVLVDKAFGGMGIPGEVLAVASSLLGFVTAAAIHQAFFPKRAMAADSAGVGANEESAGAA